MGPRAPIFMRWLVDIEEDVRVAIGEGDVRVIDTGNGWDVIVDGVRRGNFPDPAAAARWARKWGF